LELVDDHLVLGAAFAGGVIAIDQPIDRLL
jgi:hypothetical protein